MKKVSEMMLTDMMDCTVMPQMVGRMLEEYDKEQKRFICKTLTELNIDENILANQVKEIRRLNDLLQEYKDLEEQGLLLRLPCKVGDTIYEIGRYNEIRKWEIAHVGTDGEYIILFDTFGYTYFSNAIGETVFFTREEAEAKLKEMEG